MMLDVSIRPNLCTRHALELNAGVLDISAYFSICSLYEVRGHCYCSHVVIHRTWVCLQDKKRKLRKLNTTEKVYIWFKELEYKVFSLIRVTQIEISVTKMLFYAR